MGKRGVLGTVALFGLGVAATLAIGEAATPGSSAPVVQAATTGGGNLIQGTGQLAVDAANTAGPVAASVMGAVQNSGIGNVFNPTPAPAQDPTAVPPAAATPAKP